MADITIQIDKIEVYEEVSKVTAYIGGKNIDASGNSRDSVGTFIERYGNK